MRELRALKQPPLREDQMLFWGMRYFAKQIELWRREYDPGRGERIAKELLNSSIADEHKAALRTAWGG